MHPRFFDPNAPIGNYGPLSGKGVMSAYGPIEPADVGVGMLAPYNTSDCKYANPNTDIKTGGSNKKDKKKKMREGAGLIPYVSTDGIDGVGNTVDAAISDFTSFLKNLDNEYIKSTEVAESIKIGKERLIQGGNKEIKSKKNAIKKSKDKEVKKSDSKKSDSKDKEVKRTESKKSESKKSDVKKEVKEVSKKIDNKKKKYKKGGSNGSDFALTLNSRGPANAPDNMWGIDGEKWFRQFNKTGDYIPNSQLKYAATPLLAGKGDSNVVVGYDEPDLNYSFKY